MSTTSHSPRDPIPPAPTGREVAQSVRSRLRAAGVPPSPVSWSVTSDDLPYLAHLLGVTIAELVTVQT